MRFKCRCGEYISEARLKIGYNYCLTCGAKKANKEIARKARCTAPAYNKGAYQYISSEQMARDVGKK